MTLFIFLFIFINCQYCLSCFNLTGFERNFVSTSCVSIVRSVPILMISKAIALFTLHILGVVAIISFAWRIIALLLLTLMSLFLYIRESDSCNFHHHPRLSRFPDIATIKTRYQSGVVFIFDMEAMLRHVVCIKICKSASGGIKVCVICCRFGCSLTRFSSGEFTKMLEAFMF